MNYKTDLMDLRLGDCMDRLRELPDNSIDSIVTDPPYGLSFMGKKWDYDVPSVEVWQECLRVLKPGGHLLAFAGTRTQHRMAVRIEDAGFEIRDMIAWVYGSGFPKSLDVSKAIDKAAGAEREVVGARVRLGDSVSYESNGESMFAGSSTGNVTAPATEAARQWQGWGTALKPALEPITVARKPIVGTVAANVLDYGTGGLNIDGCRVGAEVRTYKGSGSQPHKLNAHGKGDTGIGYMDGSGKDMELTATGRWPANLIHDGSEEVVAGFPVTTSGMMKAGTLSSTQSVFCNPHIKHSDTYGDSGSAARFFYCAKASKRDRDEGLEGFELGNNMRVNGPRENEEAKHATLRANTHPTVKPTDLMRYLCRLVTPPNGTVLDPFMGSGSTGKAAMREGFRFVGIERDEQYFEIAKARIESAVIDEQEQETDPQMTLF